MPTRQSPRVCGGPDDQHRHGTSLLLATDDDLADELAARLGLDRATVVARQVLARWEALAADVSVPCDLDTEAAIIGAAMMSAQCLVAATNAGWSPEVCWHPAHRRIATALVDHVAEVGVVDARTCVRVADRLRAQHLLAEGDVERITEAMATAFPHPPGVAIDAARLVELADKRVRLAEVEAELAGVGSW